MIADEVGSRATLTDQAADEGSKKFARRTIVISECSEMGDECAESPQNDDRLVMIDNK